MQIRIVDNVDKDKWNSALEKCGNYLFHRYEWMEQYKKAKFIVAEEDSQIKGGYPIFFKNFFGMPILNAYGYPFGDNEDVRIKIIEKFKKIPSYVKIVKIDFPDNKKITVFESFGFKLVPSTTMVINLMQSLDDILKKIDYGIRKDIKRAEKSNLEFTEISAAEYESFKKFWIDVIKAQKFKQIYIDENIRKINIKNFYNLYGIKFKNKFIAGAVICKNFPIFYLDSQIFSREYKKLEPFSFLRWKLVQLAKEKEFRYFTVWVGFDNNLPKDSKPYRVRKYNIKWGADIETSGILVDSNLTYFILKLFRNPNIFLKLYLKYAC